jgi:hypothetical protein
MKNKLLKFIPIISFLALSFPVFVFAQASTNSSTLTDVVGKITTLFKAILPVLVSLGVIYFIWGMVQYFIGDSEEAKKTGRDRIVYAIIGLAVIVSLWGLVTILGQTLGLNNNTVPTLPTTVQGTGVGGCPAIVNFADLLDFGVCIINNSVIPLIFSIAIVMFFWGAVKFFIIDADEESKREQGKQFMLWSIIALAVMIGIWSLVNILGATFGLHPGVLPTAGGQ